MLREAGVSACVAAMPGVAESGSGSAAGMMVLAEMLDAVAAGAVAETSGAGAAKLGGAAMTAGGSDEADCISCAARAATAASTGGNCGAT